MVQTATDPSQGRLRRGQRYLSARLQKLDEHEGLSTGWLALAFVLAVVAGRFLANRSTSASVAPLPDATVQPHSAEAAV